MKQISNAGEVLVLGNSSRSGSWATVHMCPGKNVDVLITDDIEGPGIRQIRKAGV